MSMIFRSIAALSRKFVTAMTPAAIIMVGLIVYTGFAIPVTQMRGWSRWINYIDPIGYGFEALLINEFHNREFSCSQFIPFGPGYENVAPNQRICSVVGSQPGASSVNGDVYIGESYAYFHAHKWRNIGILFAFMIVFLLVYLLATGERLLGDTDHVAN
jgi:ATP-binding cassette subfamily G (WHITE) protein 2 (PDR)